MRKTKAHLHQALQSTYRCREKQRKEEYRLQTVNRKLNAMNKLLMEENDRLPYYLDFHAGRVPEVLRPLYESPKILAQKMTIAALHHIRQISQETGGDVAYGRQPAVSRMFCQRLSKGFNDAVNGFQDDGWTLQSSDGIDDVTIMINSSPNKLLESHATSALYPSSGGILCAKASMLLQNVPPGLLVRFIREHRSEWADYGVDAYSAASVRASPYSVPRVGACNGLYAGQVMLPLCHTIENEEFLEVARLESHGFNHDTVITRDMFLLQLCSGMDENSVNSCAQLVFAPIDEAFADDVHLLPSGFRVIPLESKMDSPNRTLDLASALEVGTGSISSAATKNTSHTYSCRSVLTIAFQFTYEDHQRENVTTMARDYVRNIVISVQKVALAISPSQLCNSRLGENLLPASPEARTLARWISKSYRFHTGASLLRSESLDDDTLLENLWRHSDSIMCCSLKASPVFTFANQSGLDMLETTLLALQDLTLDKMLDDNGRKGLCQEFPKIMQQGYAYLPGGICMSSMGRPVSYEQAVAWKVMNDEEAHHCLAFTFVNWSFV